MPQEKIIIKFEKKGAPELIKALNNLAKAQKNVEKGLVDTKAKFTALNPKMLQLSASLKSQGLAWKDLGISTKISTKALMGNKTAIALVDARMKTFNATAATAITNTGLLATSHNRLGAQNKFLARSFATLRSQLLLVSFGAMLIERALVSLVKAYGRQEAANEKLRVGLGNVQDTTEGVTQRLVDYSAALQQTTAFGDEMITTGMVQFTTFGLNEKAIKALTPQVLNVARAIQTVSGTMPDLNSLFIAFGKATTTGIGTLTRYGVVLTETERAQLGSMSANESAVKIAEILERQYGGLAEAYAKTTAGMLDAAAAAKSDLAEAFGEVLAPAVIGVSKVLVAMFKLMSPTRIARVTAAVVSFGIAFGGAKVAVLLYSGAMRKAAIATIGFTKALAKNPIALIAVTVSTATVALGEYFGLFDFGNKTLTDAQKNQLKLIETTSELTKAQEEGAEKLQNQLDLLSAKTETDKMLIQLGHEASDTERKLIGDIVAKTQAIKDEAQALKDLERIEKSTASLRDQALLLRMKSAGVDEKFIKLKELQVEGQNALSKEMQGFVEIDARNLENVKLTVAGTETLTDAQIEYLNALKLVLEGKIGLIIAGDKEKEQLATIQDVYAETYSSIADLVTANQNRIIAGIREQNQIEIAELKKTTAYKRATEAEQAKMEAEIKKSREKDVIDAFRLQQLAQVGQVWMNIALAVTREYTGGLIKGLLSQPLLMAVGGVQSAAIMAQKPPKMEQGGMIGGRRHSQGGTMINAEAGEFVMSRSAVESVGIENLNRMNQGGGGGAVTVNVSGNVLSQDFVEGELAENIKEAIRRGTDFGIS